MEDEKEDVLQEIKKRKSVSINRTTYNTVNTIMTMPFPLVFFSDKRKNII